MKPDEGHSRRLVPLIVIDEATKKSPWLDGRTKLAKLVFLVRQQEPHAFWDVAGPGNDYKFVPYYYGPFSKELLDDVEDLERERLVEVHIESLGSKGEVSEYWYRPTQEGRRLLHATGANRDAEETIRRLVAQFAQLSRSSLVKYVYRLFPDFVPQ